MIQRSGAGSWQEDLNKFVEIYDISADALVSYFTPLEEFLEENEEEFEYKSGATADRELEELEKRILHEINNPTTPPPTTTTQSSMTKAPLPKITSSVRNISKTEQSLESKSSVYVSENEPKNPVSSLPTELEKSLSTPDLLDEQDNKPKINTSKAVWAVSAVLIAIVVICIIVIFGRQRCRKTPKNRRYV